jgi:hypothetical protein
MMDERARLAIESSDTDELLRIVDGMCEARAWDELHRLRAHCRAAVERGKQVWSIDEHVRYRLALEAPAEHAGPAVSEGPARFTLGPLPEVAAEHHTWVELAPHLGPGPERTMTAHERVVRGEAVDGDEIDPFVLELPPALQPWEPDYPLAHYRPDRVETPTPARPLLRVLDPIHGSPRLPPDEATRALASLAEIWVEQSSGRVETVAARGGVAEGLGALGVPTAIAAPVTASDAMAWMGWAAASGAAHGRRRGAASGRFGAWWAAAAVVDLPWPPDPAELGEAVDRCSWHLWSDGSETGWNLRLAVTDPEEEITWVIAAVDDPPEDAVR